MEVEQSKYSFQDNTVEQALKSALQFAKHELICVDRVNSFSGPEDSTPSLVVIFASYAERQSGTPCCSQ